MSEDSTTRSVISPHRVSVTTHRGQCDSLRERYRVDDLCLQPPSTSPFQLCPGWFFTRTKRPESAIVPTMDFLRTSAFPNPLTPLNLPLSLLNVSAVGLLGCFLIAPPIHADPAQAHTCSSALVRAEFASDGQYSVHLAATNSLLRGKEPDTKSGAAPEHGSVERSQGHDALGDYCELRFRSGTASAQTDSIRVYRSSPVVTFRTQNQRNTTAPLTFPVLSGFASTMHRLGFRVQPFGGFQFNFLGTQGPWVLFDDQRNAFVLSPADHFFVSKMEMQQNTLHSSLVDAIHNLPAGFTHTTVLVVGSGIPTTLTSWGHAMQSWAARTPLANDSDTLLRSLSYWTDNGATYYYKFDTQLGYTGTLLATAKKYQQAHVPIGLMQIDSWFYPKGPQQSWSLFNWKNGAGGAYLYEPDKRLFPQGMGSFAEQLHLPLAVHGRWIDQSSPYRSMYAISGNVIVDPRYWEATATWMQAAHVAVYEQDWLGSFAQAAQDLTSPQKFHDAMARSMQAHGITMQYCMPAPADYLQGTRYQNLTTIRTSDDRFEPKKWDAFLYDSQIAYALGIWPWTDVFMSNELPNLVLSTLSSGPVGVGDAMDAIDAANLRRAARADGIIVKPDHGIRPLDRVYLEDSFATARSSEAADTSASGPIPAQRAKPSGVMIALASTHQPAARVSYLFAYPRTSEKSAKFTPAELGYGGRAFVYNWRTGKSAVLDAGTAFDLGLTDGWGYAVVAPVGQTGLALVGDPQMIATAGKQRMSARFDKSGALVLRVHFATDEPELSQLLYAERPPQLRILAGHLTGKHFDPSTGQLRLKLTPGPAGYAEVSLVGSAPSPDSRPSLHHPAL